MKNSIHIGRGLLPPFPEAVVIRDTHVAKLYPDIPWKEIVIPAGEGYKTRETKAFIEDELTTRGYGRKVVLIAMGGGVVTDLTGFVAATFCRGVPLILFPTTPLAMVDAAIGGKNGVNTPLMKNAVGTIYRAESTWIDIDYISSCSEKALKNGLAEMIKHGIIWDQSYLDFLEENIEPLLKKDLEKWLPAISKSIEIKSEIVEQDPHENGLRVVLNFGHTTAHAIETLSNYTIPHGQAVLMGLIVALRLSDHPFQEKISALCTALLDEIPLFDPKELFALMARDKKALHGVPCFVLVSKARHHTLEPITEAAFIQAYSCMDNTIRQRER